jgi:hypothetical protein
MEFGRDVEMVSDAGFAGIEFGPLRGGIGQKKDHSSPLRYQKAIVLTMLLHSSFPAPSSPLLAASASTIQFNSGLALETKNPKRWLPLLLSVFFLGAKSFSDNLTLVGKVGGSGSGAVE